MTDDTTTTEPEAFADSTVAMTLYNLLAMVRGALTVEQLTSSAMKLQHRGLETEQTQRALDGLVERGRIKLQPDGTYALIARERLMVVQRDLGDYDPKAMTGGWEGWHVKDPRLRDGKGVRPLEQLLGQAATGRSPRALANLQGRPAAATERDEVPDPELPQGPRDDGKWRERVFLIQWASELRRHKRAAEDATRPAAPPPPGLEKETSE